MKIWAILLCLGWEFFICEAATVRDDKRTDCPEMIAGSTGIVDSIVGKSPLLANALQEAERFAASTTTTPILISGETGTGKELFAALIHHQSPRANKPFLTTNVASIAETLAESELFGHEKGAFTGAATQRQGIFERAEGGTVFLDEFGEISLALQAKLLRVCEGQSFTRVGGNDEIKPNVRLILATNRNLRAAVKERSFREDLFYRVSILEIKLPPLRERREDIPLIAQYFLDKLIKTEPIGGRPQSFSPAALERLSAYSWPGNIRQLKTAVERTYILSNGPQIGAEDFNFLSSELVESPGSVPKINSRNWKSVIRSLEKEVFQDAWERSGGKLPAAAKLLDLSIKDFRTKCLTLGIELSK